MKPRTPARSQVIALLAVGVIVLASIAFVVPHGSSSTLDSFRSTIGLAESRPDADIEHEPTKPAIPAAADLPAATPTAAPVSDDPCQRGAANGTSDKQGRAVFVIADVINLRAGAGLDCTVLTRLAFGQELAIHGKPVTRDGIVWRSVEINGTIGYVADYAISARDAQRTRSMPIPILMYHGINKSGGRYAVSQKQLEAQMAWLEEHGYTSITPSNLYEAIYNDIPLPEKPVMITIDDGNTSDLVFAEIVTSHGFRPVFFWPNFAELSAEEMQELAGLGEACGHTVTHAPLAPLSWEEQYAELAPNKEWLEEQLGFPVRCFGYPFGAYNGMTGDVVTTVGYDIAFDAWGETSIVGLVNPLHISRKEIEGTFDIETFAAIMIYGYS